jgi:DNA mismatch repair protein MutS
VAKLAGLPLAVVERARQVLDLLEKNDRRATGSDKALDDLPLFAAARPKGFSPKTGPSPLEDALARINPDDMTPKTALEALYALKRLAKTD